MRRLFVGVVFPAAILAGLNVTNYAKAADPIAYDQVGFANETPVKEKKIAEKKKSKLVNEKSEIATESLAPKAAEGDPE